MLVRPAIKRLFCLKAKNGLIIITVPQISEREGGCLVPLGKIPLTQLLRSPGFLATTFTASLSP